MRVEPGVDNSAYQIGVINANNSLKDHPVLETDEDPQVVADPHGTEETKKGQVDSEIDTLRGKVETGETSKYAIHEGKLYYLSGRDEEVRPRLYVPKDL